MNIAEASNELYSDLRKYNEVIGAGVKRRNNVDYIIIYITEATQSILAKIPREYHGNKVETQATRPFVVH